MKNLNRYQKGVMIFMAVMAAAFLAIYSVTISRVGFEYKGAILAPSQENGNTVYSGKIKGRQARFTVSADRTVVFQYGDKTYGPYTMKEDPAAIPKDQSDVQAMTGVELRQGDSLLFRGGVLELDDGYLLYDEDGATTGRFEITYVSSDGIERDGDGNVVDPVKPSAHAILKLMNGPRLTHKGQWSVWFWGVFVCTLNVLSILFADELFYWNLQFRIRDADYAEPSDWEIAGRYLGWTALALAALVIFIVGLQ